MKNHNIFICSLVFALGFIVAIDFSMKLVGSLFLANSFLLLVLFDKVEKTKGDGDGKHKT